MFHLSGATHRSLWVPEIYPELAHGPDDGHQALYGVGEDHRLILQALFLTVPCLVYYLHLLDYGALSRLPSTKQQQLDLPAGLLYAGFRTLGQWS